MLTPPVGSPGFCLGSATLNRGRLKKLSKHIRDLLSVTAVDQRCGVLLGECGVLLVSVVCY